MVLRHPHGMEAQLLGVDALLQSVADELVGVLPFVAVARRVVGEGEVAQLHGGLLWGDAALSGDGWRVTRVKGGHKTRPYAVASHLELFVVAGEELAHLLHHGLFVVDAVEHQGVGGGVASEEAFVQELAGAESAEGGVPC